MITKFTEIALLPDNNLQRLLQHVDNETLLVALCNNESVVCPRAAQVFSKKGCEIFYYDLERLSSQQVSLEHQQWAQNEILRITNNLMAQGKISEPLALKKIS